MDENALREDIRSTLSVIGEENRTENVLQFGVKLGVSTLSDYILLDAMQFMENDIISFIKAKKFMKAIQEKENKGKFENRCMVQAIYTDYSILDAYLKSILRLFIPYKCIFHIDRDWIVFFCLLLKTKITVVLDEKKTELAIFFFYQLL